MKNWRRSLSILLALICVLGLFSSTTAASARNGLAKLTVQQFPSTPLPAVTVDPANPLACQMLGLYEGALTAEDEEERVIAQYFPKGLAYRQPEVAIAVPEGNSYLTFFQASGWKAVSDEYGIVIALLIPGDKGWKADETAYMEAAYGFMDARTYYQAQDSAFYLVGYDKGAEAAMAQAVMHADRYAGVACFGLDDMNLSVLKEAAETESAASGVMQSEVAVPVWIGAKSRTDSVKSLINHWKTANECGDEPTSSKYATEIYEFPKFMATSHEITYSHVSKVQLSINKDFTDRSFTKAVYSTFLMRTRRQDSGDINALRAFATNSELGMDHVKLVVNGITREFYVYTPSAVKKGKIANVPVVFGFHGGGGAGEEFANRSGLYKIAEERNFIAVFPTGSRGGSPTAFKASTTWALNDLPFFEAMRSYVLGHYSTDSTRVYTVGQSMGGVMSHYIALRKPQLVAAACSTSAVIDIPGLTGKVEDITVPMMYSIGQKDRYFQPGGMSVPNLATTIQYWRGRYAFDETPDTVAGFVNGNFVNDVYTTDEGVPLFRLQTVTDKIHAIIPDELYLVYDFFALYSRDGNGTLYYMGQAVD